jgi:hypothetical protein
MPKSLTKRVVPGSSCEPRPFRSPGWSDATQLRQNQGRALCFAVSMRFGRGCRRQLRGRFLPEPVAGDPGDHWRRANLT